MSDLDAFTMFGAGLCAGVGAMLLAYGSPGAGVVAFICCALNIGTVILRHRSLT